MSNETFDNLTELDLLTLCMYGEARNQGLDGTLAVGEVVLNRAKRGGWWGSTVREVILKPWQFSCFNESDPNRMSLEHLAQDMEGNLKRLSVLRTCWWIAKGLIEGNLMSIVGPATHYHTKLMKPVWKEKLRFIKTVGDHLFYEEA